MEIEKRFDRDDDPYNPPKRWLTPVYGSGLTVNGEKPEINSTSSDDWGIRHGYCFMPQTYSGELSSGIVSLQKYTRHGFNPELQERTIDPRLDIGRHPYCATLEEAVEWLVSRELIGEVIRYAHHRPPQDRGPRWEFNSIKWQYTWSQYMPWLEAGVVAAVVDTSGTRQGRLQTYRPECKIFRLP